MQRKEIDLYTAGSTFGRLHARHQPQQQIHDRRRTEMI